MKVENLNRQDGWALLGATTRVVLTHEDLTETTANTAQVFTPITTKDGTVARLVAMKLITALADASDAAFNSCTTTSGDGGDVDRFLVATQLNVNGTEITTAAGVAALYAYTGADTIDITINSMSAKSLSDIDTGEVHYYYEVRDLPTISQG